MTQVTRLIEALLPECHGVSLAGAGGGGFLVAVTKKPNSIEKIRSIVRGLPGSAQQGATVHAAGIAALADSIGT